MCGKGSCAPPTGPAPGVRGRWSAEQATPHLAVLARHLDRRLHTTSLAWWELARAVPPVLVGLSAGLPSGFLLGLLAGLDAGPLFGLAVGSVAGIAIGIFIVMHTWGTLTVAAQSRRPRAGPSGDRTPTPRSVLVRNRVFSLVTIPLLAAGMGGGYAYIGLSEGLRGGIVGGLVGSLLGGLLGGVLPAWGAFGLARVWLAVLYRLPLRLMTFLSDARERGVLHQAGATWEFAHPSLQRHLANRPRRTARG